MTHRQPSFVRRRLAVVFWPAGLGVVLLTAAGLIAGAGWLTWSVAGTGLPLGTLATGVSMTVLPALTLPWACGRGIERSAWFLIVAGALWLPVSALWAGNLSLSFSGASAGWWPLTIGQVALSLALCALVAGRVVLRRRSRRRDVGAG